MGAIRNPQYDLVVIGASKGGLPALQKVLGGLPRGFRLPVAVVLHRGKDSDGTLPAALQKATTLAVVEPDDKEAIVAGSLYLAPSDYHLLVESSHFALSVDEPVEYARPSIDVLFESAAACHRERTIGVILTGGNEDGAAGLAAIAARGGLAVVQDPKTAEAAAMPEAAIAAVPKAKVLPLEEIGPFLTEACRKDIADFRL